MDKTTYQLQVQTDFALEKSRNKKLNYELEQLKNVRRERNQMERDKVAIDYLLEKTLVYLEHFDVGKSDFIKDIKQKRGAINEDY